MTKIWQPRRADQITPQEWLQLRTHLRERAERRGARLAIRDEMIVLAAFYTGLRRSELAGLTVGDLNLKNEHPFIVVRRGKGEKFREVAIGPKLRALFKRFVRQKAAWGEALNDDAPLFLSERGAFSGSGIARVFRRACVEAGLRPYHIHLARHFFGANLYAATKDLRVVRVQLGHSRITTTQVYMDLRGEEAAEAVAQYEDFIGTPRKTKPKHAPQVGSEPAKLSLVSGGGA